MFRILLQPRKLTKYAVAVSAGFAILALSLYVVSLQQQIKTLSAQLGDSPSKAEELQGKIDAALTDDAGSLCPPRIATSANEPAWREQSSRCIFIDTANIGHVLHHFETFTPFTASSCKWELWTFLRFGPPETDRKDLFRHLRENPRLTIRFIGGPATGSEGDKATFNTSTDEDYLWDTVPSNMTDISRLMHANLRPEDFITVALHPDEPYHLYTKYVVKRLARSGVARWVDRWLISAGLDLGLIVPQDTMEYLMKKVPDLRMCAPLPNPRRVMEASEVTYLLISAKQQERQQENSSSVSPATADRKQVYIDMGMHYCDTIYMFLTFVPDPWNWEIWGMEAVPAIAQNGSEICAWAEQNYELRLKPEEWPGAYGLRRIHILNNAAWIKTTELEFHTGKPASGSIFEKNWADGPVMRMQALDVAEWIRSKFSETSYIFLKMDIEYAEYPVLQHMMADGVACWMDKWAVEFHSLESVKAQPLLPPDRCWRVRQAFHDFATARGIPLAYVD
mmetsp:Transcript_38031/g.88939  ORF Transcript_38031/g.88939 Transcript_38031/m.88939 type:complete len:508 (+) Transcript_38031:124-1647(+)